MWPKTDAQRTLLATAQAIAEQIASTAPAHDRDASFPFEHFEAMRAAGYLGAAVPREFGGGGHGLDDLVLAQLANPFGKRGERFGRGEQSIEPFEGPIGCQPT